MTNNNFPLIMGIINVTPDSFSDGGLHLQADSAIKHALFLASQGADILDIGGESTRPGAISISVKEELNRVIPVIQGIRDADCELPISIDTIKPEVARKAIEAGATIINDISGLALGTELALIAAEYDASLIIMHSKGTPQTMQINPYYHDIVQEIASFLVEKAQIAKECGVKDIILDIGIGFGKTVDHNWQLLSSLSTFATLGYPLMLGISRKSFIGKSLLIDTPAERDITTALLHAMLLHTKMHILRVHNVKLMDQLRVLYSLLEQNKNTKGENYDE